MNNTAMMSEAGRAERRWTNASMNSDRFFRGEYLIVLRDGTELTSSRRYRKNLDAILAP